MPSSKLRYLLGADHKKWSFSDTVSLTYVTPDIIANKIIELADEHFHGLSDKVIWDMFAGIGADALRLSKFAGKVICTEINPVTFADLKENYSCCNSRNVDLINGDCSRYKGTPCDIVYFDPPWGDTFRSGVPFDFDDVVLEGDVSVLKLAKEMHDRHSIIIKSPILSDSFEKLFKECPMKIFTFTQQKLKFIFIAWSTPRAH